METNETLLNPNSASEKTLISQALMHWLESALGGSGCHCDTVAIAVRFPPIMHFERLQQMPPNVQGLCTTYARPVLAHLYWCIWQNAVKSLLACSMPSRGWVGLGGLTLNPTIIQSLGIMESKTLKPKPLVNRKPDNGTLNPEP